MEYIIPGIANTDELFHYGIKGMKWGVRRFRRKDGTLTKTGKDRYYKESDKKIRTNKDGSQTIPCGFIFNRVGKSSIDVNKSGALYVSHGKDDASRYIKSLGPTTLNKLLRTQSDTVQHISVKRNIRMASEDCVAKESAKILLQNRPFLDKFNNSLYSLSVKNDLYSSISTNEIHNALKKSDNNYMKKLSYGISSCLADPNFVNEAKLVYSHFRKNGYDAIPDIHDIYSGTSNTATIIINPDKVKVSSTTVITKEILKNAKQYTKKIGKLKVNDIIN